MLTQALDICPARWITGTRRARNLRLPLHPGQPQPPRRSGRTHRHTRLAEHLGVTGQVQHFQSVPIGPTSLHITIAERVGVPVRGAELHAGDQLLIKPSPRPGVAFRPVEVEPLHIKLANRLPQHHDLVVSGRSLEVSQPHCSGRIRPHAQGELGAQAADIHRERELVA